MLCKVTHCTGGAFQTVPSLTNCAGLTRDWYLLHRIVRWLYPKGLRKLLNSTVSLYSCLSCEDHSNHNHASCKCKFMIRIHYCCGGEPEWVCYLCRELWTVSSGTLTRRRPVTPCMYLSDYIAIVIMQIMQSPYTLVEAYICRETGDESPSMHP